MTSKRTAVCPVCPDRQLAVIPPVDFRLLADFVLHFRPGNTPIIRHFDQLVCMFSRSVRLIGKCAPPYR